MTEDFCPVISGIPSDLTGRIHLNRHNLTDASALHEDNESSDSATLAAAFLPPIYICSNERIMARHIGPWNDTRARYRESI